MTKIVTDSLYIVSMLSVKDEKRHCPVINKIISIQDCFDATMVLEDGCPKNFALLEIVDKKDFEKICKNCFYYKNL